MALGAGSIRILNAPSTRHSPAFSCIFLLHRMDALARIFLHYKTLLRGSFHGAKLIAYDVEQWFWLWRKWFLSRSVLILPPSLLHYHHHIEWLFERWMVMVVYKRFDACPAAKVDRCQLPQLNPKAMRLVVCEDIFQWMRGMLGQRESEVLLILGEDRKCPCERLFVCLFVLLICTAIVIVPNCTRRSRWYSTLWQTHLEPSVLDCLRWAIPLESGKLFPNITVRQVYLSSFFSYITCEYVPNNSTFGSSSYGKGAATRMDSKLLLRKKAKEAGWKQQQLTTNQVWKFIRGSV